MEGFIFGAIIGLIAGAIAIYVNNRSRCTLEEAARLSGSSEEEIREMIGEHVLSYRSKYVLFGPHTIDPRTVDRNLEAYRELKRMRAEQKVTLRRMAEEASARMAADNRRRQAELDEQQEQLERMKAFYDEMLKQMSVALMPAPVIAAFRTLGLSPEASFSKVRKHYRDLAKQYHPDAGGSSSDFTRIQQAHDCIVNWLQTQSKAQRHSH